MECQFCHMSITEGYPDLQVHCLKCDDNLYCEARTIRRIACHYLMSHLNLKKLK